MSIENNAMQTLLQRQELERQGLAEGVYTAWRSLLEKEKEILAPYNGKLASAPKDIKAKFEKGRNAYFKEWGSEGKLAVLIRDRHVAEREEIVEKTARRDEVLERLRMMKNKSKEKERGR